LRITFFQLILAAALSTPVMGQRYWEFALDGETLVVGAPYADTQGATSGAAHV